MLRMDSVSKAYRTSGDDVPVLRNVALAAAPGEFIVVRGASGCGKTTLLLSAGGLLTPDSGTVSVGDLSLYEMSGERRARVRSGQFGYVYQRFHLMPYLDVLDNVLVPTLVTGDDRRERALALITELKMDHRLRHKPAALSVGERQRTALARALVTDPGILLADEPTGNLDEDNAAIVLGRMSQFAESGGTVVLVTHDPAIRAYANRAYVMQDGRLQAPG